MEHTWIVLAMFAGLMQAVRTAAQKTLNARMSTMGTTYVRSLFGLPILLAYLATVLSLAGGGLPPAKPLYYAYTLAGATAQVLATALLITLFRLRNFAVGTMLTRVDIVITALIGAVFFSEVLTAPGVLALLVTLAGVTLMSIGRVGLHTLVPGSQTVGTVLASKATHVALGCALLFSLSYLFLREAAVVLRPDGSPFWAGAWTVVIATIFQTVALTVWLAWREPDVFAKIRPNARISTFIGLTSAVGSIGWYTAFALQNASYVRAVGQVELVFTLLISLLYFRETIRPLEYAGMALTIAGVIMFRLHG